ncbi:molybdenum cofactor cytidylyltransferase [Flavobacterium phragmitis]|uniref:Molybdenum cofactor cytidylyltransferase n=2 Tax=Flavobacterium phragmitis TaxID=739143 RepID=A0A1I1TBN1_9FLAO|nr:molybdenum cofactor cytidylyltransferase [Flavobacterium phragmitis]
MMRCRMKDKFQNKTGIIILAAGNSSRLGRPKQLLEYKESTLLKNTISEALKVENVFVLVVTGANQETITNDLNFPELKIGLNTDWQNGMSSSIVKGLSDVLNINPDCEQCIFAVCDQPFVTSLLFENLIIEQDKTKKGIIASAYSETLGIPVLFHKKYFKELLDLKGQEGAKKLIKKHSEDTVSVSFEKGNIDIDTEEDYFKLIS